MYRMGSCVVGSLDEVVPGDPLEGHTKRCGRCGADVHGCDHDDEPEACGACSPRQLATWAREPSWHQGQGAWDLDQKINMRGRELSGNRTPSAREWPRYMGKEHWVGRRRRAVVEGRI